MICSLTIESCGSEWFQSASTATESTTFSWLGIFITASPLQAGKSSLTAHDSEFAGHSSYAHLLTLHKLSVRHTLIKRMHVLRQFGVLGLLLVSCLAPTMACMVPGTQMSAQERACCRMMKDQCGQMEMPASHGCCQKTPQSVYISAPAAKYVSVHPVAVAPIWLTASELLNPNAIVARWVDRPEYSPPKSPPSAVSILRI